MAVIFGCLGLGNVAPNLADLATARGAAAVIWEVIDKVCVSIVWVSPLKMLHLILLILPLQEEPQFSYGN